MNTALSLFSSIVAPPRGTIGSGTVSMITRNMAGPYMHSRLAATEVKMAAEVRSTVVSAESHDEVTHTPGYVVSAPFQRAATATG